LATTIIIVLLLVLIAIKIPIAISMGVTAVVYFLYIDIPMDTIVQKAFGGVNSFEMTAIPLFMLAGELMNYGGISDRLMRFAQAFLGHVRGGFGVATVFTCMVYGGAAGSTLAEIAAIGPITIPEMVRQGYKREFAAAIVGVTSELGPIIPPSVIMVIAASLAQVSVGKMLLSGLIPGLLIGIGLMIVVYIISVMRNYPTEKQDKASWITRWIETKGSFWAHMMNVILIGGMIVGIFTPTETAAVAVFYCLFIGMFVYKKLKLRDLYRVCYRTAVSSAGILFVIALSNLYAYMLTREKIGDFVATLLMGFAHSTVLVYIVMMIALIPLGMLLSSTPVVMLVVPVLVPLVRQLGVDPIHFFSIVTMTALIGTLTPPVAISLYLTSQIARTKPEKTFLAMIPLIAVIYAVLILSVFIPGIITWIPNIAYK
jgi:tripartite ATP-independent transporter DctM subunit